VDVNLEIRSEGERLDTTSRNGLLVGVVVVVGVEVLVELVGVDWMREEEEESVAVAGGSVGVVSPRLLDASSAASPPAPPLASSSTSVSKLIGREESLNSARARFKLSDSELDLRGSKNPSSGPPLPPGGGGGRLLLSLLPPPPPTLDMDRWSRFFL